MRNNKAFTIVETLVAITILMIAITGPLTIANKALTAAIDAKNQMTAINLAQETMEAFKNLKDNNMANGVFLSSDILTKCAPGNYCSVSYADIETDGNTELCTTACKIYLTADGYTTDSSTGGNLTPFRRYFNIQEMEADEVYLVSVTVSWNTGAVPNEMVIKEIVSKSSLF